jgi:phospholipase C
VTSRNMRIKRRTLAALAATTMLTTSVGMMASARDRDDGRTRTPIKHVVIIFQENASFDHYFATYPNAKNTDGTPFFAKEDTPTVNGLTDGNSKFPERVRVGLHDFNPNQPAPGGSSPILVPDPNGAANPFRMTRDQIVTCSNNHDYRGEQITTDAGFMDKFPQVNNSNGAGCSNDGSTVMGYFDGNTVTAMWNWAQRFAMSDNNWGTTYGPSTPGAVNLVAGQTAGAVAHHFSGSKGPTGQLSDSVVGTTITDVFFVGPTNPVVNADVLNASGKSVIQSVQTGTLVTDLDPYLDDCGNDHGGTVSTTTIEMTGRNVGDLLNEKGVTWGWFAGGFRPAATKNPVVNDPAHPLAGVSNDPFGLPPGTIPGGLGDGSATNIGLANFQPATCAAAHTLHPDATTSFDGKAALHPSRGDYNPHHSPFQYYASTRNPHHFPPTSVAMIGRQDQANHQYDLTDFFDALKSHNLPAVSFLKAINRDDGHPGGESDPLAEQRFLVQTINLLQASPEWAETAVFIAWDDSDGWYDHATPPLVNASSASGFDAVAGDGNCGTPKADALQARCGFGPRLVLNMVSPWAKVNYVDHTLTDQASLLRFIEDNWDLNYIDGPAAHDPTTGLRTPGFALAPQKQSFDVVTGSFDNMFDFDDHPHLGRFILDPVSGAVLADDSR